MQSNNEIQNAAWKSLKGNWALAVCVYLIWCFCMGIQLIPKIGVLFVLLISGPLQLGMTYFFVSLAKGEQTKVEILLDGFKNFLKALGAFLLINILILLWMLLLIVPGIIAAYAYSMTFYILAENPQIGVMSALRKSREMMKGKKAKLFYLHCRFWAWILLGFVTLGIAFLWVTPYMLTANAHFYLDNKSKD